jgi:hypothetical protein
MNNPGKQIGAPIWWQVHRELHLKFQQCIRLLIWVQLRSQLNQGLWKRMPDLRGDLEGT